ncbi:MAG: type I restriction-modification system subunit M N-terminal domain-containing protein [Bacteroidaceae bacterium]
MWNLANILRDDGVSYGDYLEQITYLLFLNMYLHNISYQHSSYVKEKADEYGLFG